MPRLILLVATCVAAGCSTATSVRPSDRPELPPGAVVSVSRQHAGVDLSGAWATGSVGEPAVPRLEIHPQCNVSPALWIIQQSGDSVRAWALPERHAQGIPSPAPDLSGAAIGRVSGLELTMSAGGSRYLLRYDSTSGHLRGTLNNAPFWGVRLEVVRPERCVAIP